MIAILNLNFLYITFSFSKIYNEMLQTIEKADSGRDLCSFAEQYGARMETRWPEFEVRKG